MTTTLIVGASVAGVRTAQTLRSRGHKGRVVLLDTETEWPYDKPPLSKGFLKGSEQEESLSLISRAEAERLDIELLLGHRAVGIDVAEQLLEIEDLVPLSYDNLVIATGGRARPSPWGQREGIHALRTMDDARRLHNDLKPGAHLAVIGAGFIGAEVAATARAANVEVTLIDPLPYPMSRVMTPEVGDWFTRLHESHGVGTRFGLGVERVEGQHGDFQLKLTDGSELKADAVLVGIGSLPNDSWLSDSGLLVDNGVLCDHHCRAVDANNVFVAGDVARVTHPEKGAAARLEHWTNAVEQAQTVAHNIMNPTDPHAHAAVEYVWSDQYDWKIQVAGTPSQQLEHTIHGDPFKDGRAAAIFNDGEVLHGAVVVNWPRALVEARRGLMSEMPPEELNNRISALR